MKTILITGASSGIGQAIVSGLEADDWNIIKPTHTELDLNNLNDIENFANQIISNNSKIDAIIHVAGIWHNDNSALADIQFGKFSSDQIIETMNVGLTSIMILINKLMPIMSQSTVIGISGTFADGAKGWLPYYTSKRALEDFLVGLSQDCDNIKVYGISPADTATKAYDKFYHEYFAEAQDPKYISDLVKKLINNESSFDSGDIIEIRQGETKKLFHA